MNLNILDIPRIYTGIAEWMACMMYIIPFRSRRNRGRFWAESVLWLLAQCLFLAMTDDVSLYLWLPCMIAAVSMMLGMIIRLCDVDIRTAAYMCIRAFILAEFIAALEWQFHCFFWPDVQPAWWQMHGLMLVIFCGVTVIVAALERKCVPNWRELAVSRSELLTVVVIGASIFAISNMSFYLQNTPFSSQYASEIMNIRTWVDFSGVAILFAYHIQRAQFHYTRELDAMQTILENQYAQYRMSRDSIDMLNRKYHDLKHQIAALRAEQDPAVRERWLNEMESDIRTYEAQNKTGNTTLDTVLTGKSLYCQKHGITLSVVADGNSLAGLDVMDICTIFGNAMDNAIECELRIPDKSKRMIHLYLTTQKQFLTLRVENYCPEPIDFLRGLPVSRKRDSTNHGFGLKSIRHTAEKYGGTMTVTADNEWFVLKVLIPITPEN